MTALELLDELGRLVGEISMDELPRLVGALVEAEERARLRLRVEAAGNSHRPDADADVNLDAAEAARRLGLSKDYLYTNADRLPFVVKIGRRVLFSSRGLERWNRNRMGGRS